MESLIDTLTVLGYLTIIPVGLTIAANLPRPRIRYTRNGGMRFLRIGRLQLSFCICRNSI